MVVNGKSLGLGGYIDIGLLDTMEDLLVNFIGAFVFSIFGYAEAKVATWFGDPTPRLRDASHCHQWHTLI